MNRALLHLHGPCKEHLRLSIHRALCHGVDGAIVQEYWPSSPNRSMSLERRHLEEKVSMRIQGMDRCQMPVSRVFETRITMGKQAESGDYLPWR